MSILPNDSLELAILLFKSMQDCVIEAGQLRGTLTEGLDFSAVEQALEKKKSFA